jgi:DNA-binding transcriptional regulator YbjK
MLDSVRLAVAEPVRRDQGTLRARDVDTEEPLEVLTERVISVAMEPRNEAVRREIAGREKTSEESKLRALADSAMKIFSAQLFIVQDVKSQP